MPAKPNACISVERTYSGLMVRVRCPIRGPDLAAKLARYLSTVRQEPVPVINPYTRTKRIAA